MTNKVVTITAPNGKVHPVKSADEGARFMVIITNGYLDIPVDELTKKLDTTEDVEHTCGGWTVAVGDVDEGKPLEKFILTKGDVKETVFTLEAISTVCDCAINTVVKRLEKTPEGFTVKGWKITREV